MQHNPSLFSKLQSQLSSGMPQGNSEGKSTTRATTGSRTTPVSICDNGGGGASPADPSLDKSSVK